jgi:hypothetical protein
MTSTDHFSPLSALPIEEISDYGACRHKKAQIEKRPTEVNTANQDWIQVFYLRYQK